MDAFSAKQTQKPNFKQVYSPPPPSFLTPPLPSPPSSAQANSSPAD